LLIFRIPAAIPSNVRRAAAAAEASFDNQVAAPAVSRRDDAALVNGSASRLRPRRHAKPRRAAKRRHVDLRAERRFVNRHRDDHVEVVALAANVGCGLTWTVM
jgi:hypothetical protein